MEYIKNLRSKFFRSCIREPVVHIGSDFTITKVIRNTNLEVPEGLIKLSQQMQRHTIVPKQWPWMSQETKKRKTSSPKSLHIWFFCLLIVTSSNKRKKKNLHEDDKEEANVHWQMKQVTDKLKIESINRLLLPLTIHNHISNKEHILHKNRHRRRRQNHIPVNHNIIITER